jgi:hypothetical protein
MKTRSPGDTRSTLTRAIQIEARNEAVYPALEAVYRELAEIEEGRVRLLQDKLAERRRARPLEAR